MKKLKENSKPEREMRTQPPEGHCNLCWGFQEYDGQVRILYKDKQKDVNNHFTTHMRIQRFIKTYFTGMKLKNPEIKSCPECGETTEK